MNADDVISKKQQRPAATPGRTMRGHTGSVRGVVHLPDGRRIITCSHDSSLRLWDLESGAQIGEDWIDEVDMDEVRSGSPVDITEAEKKAVYTIALSPNGKTFASGGYDGKVRLWDIETGKVIAKWSGHTTAVESVCWSADGERVLSGCFKGTARVWNVKTGATVLEIKTGYMHVWAAIYSPDNTKIATGGSNEESGVKIWDAKTGEWIATLKHDNFVWSLAWTLDGKLISGSSDPIRIFDTATWQQIAILEGHTHLVYALSLSGNNRLLASASTDKTARLWNLDTNLPVGPPLQHEDGLRCAALSTDGKVLVTGGFDENIYTWDVHTILKKAGLQDLLLPIPDVLARKSSKHSGATRRPAIRARRIPPGFFDGDQSSARGTHPHSPAHNSRSARAPSSANPHALLQRFSSLFRHAQSNTDGTTELQQRPRRTIFSRGPRIVEVAAVRDRKPLAVAPRPRDRPHTQPAGTTTPGATPAQSRPIPWWAHVVLFLCCASPRQTTQMQEQQQGSGQSQASPSQTQPAAVSTSVTPPAPAICNTPPNAATAQSQPLPLRARFVLFLCCASPVYADGH